MKNRKSVIALIIAFILICAIVGAVYIGSFKNHGSKKPATEIAIPSSITTSTPSFTLSPEPKSISGEVLTCTITLTGGYDVDLRLKNLGTANRTVTIDTTRMTAFLLPGQIKKIDMILPYEIDTLKLVADSGEELKVKVPVCIVPGSSGEIG